MRNHEVLLSSYHNRLIFPGAEKKKNHTKNKTREYLWDHYMHFNYSIASLDNDFLKVTCEKESWKQTSIYFTSLLEH